MEIVKIDMDTNLKNVTASTNIAIKQGYSPYISERGTWMVYDDYTRQWVDTNILVTSNRISHEKVDEYLYNINYELIDYLYAKDYFKNENLEFNLGACSSVRKGDLYGRNFDWLYNNQVEFVIKTPASNNRHAVIGVSGSVPKLTKEFVKTCNWDEAYRILPFMIVDGINDSGLVCSTHVVPLDKGKTSGTNTIGEKLDEICSLMLPRYILDNFSTVVEAINYLKNHVSIYVPKVVHSRGFETHFMLADKNNTYVLEFVDNQLVTIDVNNYPYLTNFYLDGMVRNSDGSVYTPASKDESHNAITTNKITEHGSGLERFNLINSSYSSLNTMSDMEELLSKLNYTNTYKLSTNPFWYTEFVHDDINVASDVDKFEVAKYIELFENRDRNIPNTWQTVHSSVYNIAHKTLVIKCQEQEKSYSYKFNYLPNEILELINELQQQIQELKKG